MLYCLLFICLENMIATPGWKFQLKIKLISKLSKQKKYSNSMNKNNLSKNTCLLHAYFDWTWIKLNDYILKMKTIHVLGVQPKKNNYNNKRIEWINYKN